MLQVTAPPAGWLTGGRAVISNAGWSVTCNDAVSTTSSNKSVAFSIQINYDKESAGIT